MFLVQQTQSGLLPSAGHVNTLRLLYLMPAVMYSADMTDVQRCTMSIEALVLCKNAADIEAAPAAPQW